MATDPFNCYGDRRVTDSLGHGADISTQRADDLDLLTVEVVVRIGSDCRALDIACGLGGQAVRLAQAGARVVSQVPDLDIGQMGKKMRHPTG